MIRIGVLIGLLIFALGTPQPIESSTDAGFAAPDAAIHPATSNLANNPIIKYALAINDGLRRSYAVALTHRPVVKPRPAAPQKEIIVSLANQEMYRFEDGRIVKTHLVSTGVAGHRTPPGDYMVRNKSIKAWSNKYECSMLNWMAITPDGMFGIHGLTGNSYLRRLGHVASHGCIRLSRDDAQDIYSWADIGTPVTIVDEFDPVPYLKPPESMYGPARGLDPGIF